MKVNFHQVLVFFLTVSAGTLPVAAITAGNGSYTGGSAEGSTLTSVTSSYQAVAVPSINVSQNIGFAPLWLIIGIVLVVIALSGILWRYFNPKYVVREEDESQ